MICLRLVYAIDDRCECRALSRTGWAGQQNDTIAAVFRDLLFYRNYRRDRWLGVRVRLDHRQGGGVAVSLVVRF